MLRPRADPRNGDAEHDNPKEKVEYIYRKQDSNTKLEFAQSIVHNKKRKNYREENESVGYERKENLETEEEIELRILISSKLDALREESLRLPFARLLVLWSKLSGVGEDEEGVRVEQGFPSLPEETADTALGQGERPRSAARSLTGKFGETAVGVPPQTPRADTASADYSGSASAAPRAVPKVAPVLWKDRPSKESTSPVQWILDHYGNRSGDRKTWDPRGLTRADVGKLDPPLYNAYAQWIRRHPTDVLNLHTEGRTRYPAGQIEFLSTGWVPSSILPEEERAARRAYQAARKREQRQRHKISRLDT